MAEGEIPWAPGALAGVLGHHTVASPVAAPEGVLPLVRAARRRIGGHRARTRLYGLAMRIDALDELGDVIQALASEGDPRDIRTARWLAFEGRHRSPVKLGIALLALGHYAEDRPRLLLLARHDDFSSSVMRTLRAVTGDRGASAYAVARVAYGWGRVGAVDYLDLTDPVVCRWLVCGGYRNTVMDEYTAINAAHADLLGQLQRIVSPDLDLVNGAFGVVQTLLHARIHGGPGSDIRHYAQAPEVIELLLELLDDADLRRFQLARDTRSWLLSPPEDEDEDEIPTERRQPLLALVDGVLTDPEWLPRTLHVLAAPDDPRFELAVEVGVSLGHDVFPSVFAALRSHPATRRWYEAATSAGPQRISSVVELAERHLLREHPDEYDALLDHPAIYVLEKLPAERPGLGWRLVAAALYSRQTDRWPAYRVLQRWGRARWPDGAEQLLRDRLVTSTDELERQRVARLLDDSPEPA